MGGSGSGTNAYLRGRNEESVKVDEGGLHVQNAFPQYISFRLRTTAEESGSQLPDIPSSYVVIRNSNDPDATNEPIFICGVGRNANAMNSMFLRDDESWAMPIDNANKILIHCMVAQDIRISVYANHNDEIRLSDFPNVDLQMLDLTIPTVLSTSPANGAGGVNRDTDVIKTMSEPIDAATVTITSYSIAPAPPAPGTWIAYIDSQDNTKLVLNPDSTLAAGTLYTVTLTTDITDTSGNHMAANNITTFTTEAPAPPPDVGAPTIISRTPDVNATDVSIAITPTTLFDEDLNASTVTSSTVKFTKVSTGASIPFVLTLENKRTIRIVPTQSLEYGTQYQVQLIGGSGGIKDLAGNPLTVTTTWTFTTAAQTYTLVYNVGYTHDNLLSESYSNWIGLKVENSSSQMNQIRPRKVIVQMKKVLAPTGTLYCQIRSNATTVIKQIGNPLDVSTITTSLMEYTFTESGNAVRLIPGYRLVIAYSGGDANNYVIVRRNESNPFDGTNTYEIEENGSNGDTNNTGFDFGGKVYE